MATALIQADSECSAYELYLREFVPCDEIEDGDGLEYGTFDGSGGYYSESTLGYISVLNTDRYTFDFEIVLN